MRIVILSDTHGLLRPEVLAALEGNKTSASPVAVFAQGDPALKVGEANVHSIS